MVTQIPSHCSRCGAPLKKEENYLVCKYCGQSYWISNFDHIQGCENEIHSKEYHLNDSHSASQTSPLPPSFIQTSDSKEKTKPPKKIDWKQVRLAIALIVFFYIIVPMSIALIQKMIESINTQTDTLSELPLQQIIYDYYYDSVEYPADSIENSSISSVLLLIDAQGDRLTFYYYIQNSSGRELDTNLKSEHLEITSLSASNNLGESYTCSFKRNEHDSSILVPGEVRHLGILYCQGSIRTKVTSIDIDIDNPNWGNSHYHIPLIFDSNDLTPKNSLFLSKDGNYSLQIDLHSKKPQVIRLNKREILISDDKGTQYSLDHCTPDPFQGGEEKYYVYLTKNDAHYNIYQKYGLLSCAYDGSFPLDVNSMTISLKIDEKTYNSTAIIDRLDGQIDFIDQTSE